MNGKIADFLNREKPPTPCLVMDVAQVGRNYRQLRRGLPGASLYYAVKANPAPPVLKALLAQGACFDAASYEEIELLLGLGAPPQRVSWGNTVKKESEIALAWRRGVAVYAFDCCAEMAKLARAAPGAKVVCRVHLLQNSAACPVTEKFGCSPKEACRLLAAAAGAGLLPWGVSFHVGSQQTEPEAWIEAVETAAAIFRSLRESGLGLRLLNLGGGFPVRYSHDVPDIRSCGGVIIDALARCFGNAPPEVVTEPGRAVAASAGVIQSEVLLVSRRNGDSLRWVYMDVGRSSGLVESVNRRIVYPVTTPYDDLRPRATGPARLAGPTCDWSDIISEGSTYALPLQLKAGDRLLLGNTGAYTQTCSTVGFNGFAPLSGYYI